MSLQKPLIRFQNADVRFSLKQKREIKLYLAKQLGKTGKAVQLNYIFCSDDFLLDINQKFLNHDYYTDIITFPLTDTDEVLEAEIYISIDRVKDNALQLKVSFEHEIKRVVFHGALHLLGYKDKTKVQKEEMRKKEESWIRELELINM